MLALADVLARPLFVESHRLAPFQPRGTDVDVVLDLMIHDIDLIQELVGAPLVGVDAVGVPVLSARDDIANARLRFEGGCVANVTASRVSLKSERRMRIFQRDAYLSIDFQAGEATIARKGVGERLPGVPEIGLERRRFEQQRPVAARDRGVSRGDPRPPAGRGLGRGRPPRARGRAQDHRGARAASLSAPPQGAARPEGSGARSIQARMSSHTTWRCRSRSSRW